MKSPYLLTAHASKVIEEREILIEWVVQTLKKPERLEDDINDSLLCHALAKIPEHGNRVLRVVYNKSTTPWRIVTVYFDRAQRGKL